MQAATQQKGDLQQQNKALMAELDRLQHDKDARTMQIEQVST